MNVECCTIHKEFKDPLAEHARISRRPPAAARARREVNEEDRNASGARNDATRRKEKEFAMCGSSPRRERERATDDGMAAARTPGVT